MTMVTRVALIHFASPLTDSVNCSLAIEMTSWTHSIDFAKRFQLREIKDETGLWKAAGRTSLEEFLKFQGHTLQEALQRFWWLREMQTDGKEGKPWSDFQRVEMFYAELEKGNKPKDIHLTETEWY